MEYLLFLKDPQIYDTVIQLFLSKLREIPQALWPEMEKFGTSDVRLRCLHRLYVSELSDMCTIVLTNLDAVERLFSMCDEDRKERIIHELSQNQNKSFNIEDKSLFPETIDFLNELETRFEMITKTLSELDEMFQKLQRNTHQETGNAQDEEQRAQRSKNCAWYATAVIATGAVGLTAATGGLVAFSTAALVVKVGLLGKVASAAGAAASWGFTYVGYNKKRVYFDKERKSREAREGFDSLNKAAHNLESITTECRSPLTKLTEKHGIGKIPKPLVSTVLGSIRNLLSSFNPVNFDRERGEIRCLLRNAQST
jgi:hypothetical protein